jgi:hypothetical protein
MVIAQALIFCISKSDTPGGRAKPSSDSSPDLDTTKHGLWHRLEDNRHLGQALQSDWKLRGAEAFEYIILEVIEEDMSPLGEADNHQVRRPSSRGRFMWQFSCPASSVVGLSNSRKRSMWAEVVPGDHQPNSRPASAFSCSILGVITTKAFVCVISLLRRVCVDVLEKTSRNFTPLEAFPDAEIAILVFADGTVRVERTFHVGASAKMLFHECDLLCHERPVAKLKLNQRHDASAALGSIWTSSPSSQRSRRWRWTAFCLVSGVGLEDSDSA